MSDKPRSHSQVSDYKRGVKLFLGIGTDWYKVTTLSPNPVGNPAWRLEKWVGGGDPYDVAVIHGRLECTCPDYEIRRERLGETCKHLDALIEVGLLPDLRMT